MSKYAPLAEFLRQRPENVFTMTFEEVEKVLGGPLPPSARAYDPWWVDRSAGSTHPQAHAGWLAAGWVVAKVERRAGRVTFQRFRVPAEQR